MPDGGVAIAPVAARIGPNALLQLVPVLDRIEGCAARRALFADAGVAALPDGCAMIDEAQVAAVHRALRRRHPRSAARIAAAAGRATGDYILAHRIPAPAQRLLRVLPAGLAARFLTRAIGAHAWTFCGSGHLSTETGHPVVFTIADNPVVRGEISTWPVCHWHAGVFERLFARLVHRDARARETACCAMGQPACRFEIRWR